MLMPVDEFLPATYGQHLRKELAEAIYSEFMRVCARDRLRGHAALWKRDRSQCLRGMNLAQGARRSVKKMFAAVDLTPRDIDLEKFWSLWTRAPPVRFQREGSIKERRADRLRTSGS